MNLIFFLLVLALSHGTADESVIHPNLLKEMKTGKPKNVFVSMKGGNDKVFDDINSRSFPSREDKIRALMAATKANSALSQSRVLTYLKENPLIFDTFSLSNEVYIKNAGPLAIMALSKLPNVASVREEKIIQIESSFEEDQDEDAKIHVKQSNNNEWGIEAINAPDAWNSGFNGSGMVVAIIDTGVNMKHKDLQNYRGGQFSWLDPKPPKSQQKGDANPNDNQGHGSHVAGIAVGQNGCGVAPGAKWIACRGCTKYCSEYNLKTCGEWVTCPYKQGGTKNDCNATNTPHVVNNSWGGGGGSTWFNEFVKAWVTAGIIPVFSVGNDGDSCRSLGSPGDQANLIGVGATNSSSKVARISSRGPGEDKNLNKPDLAAPGQDIFSCSHSSNRNRVKKSGTSMAAPHVAGAAALVVQAAGDQMDDSKRFEKVMKWLKDSSVPSVSTGQSCGDSTNRIISDYEYPNYQVGSGIIDVFAAIKEISK